MIDAIVSVRKAATGYGRQQFYAERAQSLSVRKVSQIGLQDKVSLSPEARLRIAKPATAKAPVTASPTTQIAYEDPRRTIRATAKA